MGVTGGKLAIVEKNIRKAIDEIIAALESLPESARATAIRAACEHLGLPGFLHDSERRPLWCRAPDPKRVTKRRHLTRRRIRLTSGRLSPETAG